jgi:hypothetical protein
MTWRDEAKIEIEEYENWRLQNQNYTEAQAHKKYAEKIERQKDNGQTK